MKTFALGTALAAALLPQTAAAHDATGMEVNVAAVKSQVADLIADYGFAADRRDTAATSALFLDNGVLAIPAAGTEVQGQAAIAAAFGQVWQAVAKSGQQRRHIITGLRILETAPGKVRFRAIMNVAGTGPDGAAQLYMTGFYMGEAVPTPDGWRLQRLEINVDRPLAATPG